MHFILEYRQETTAVQFMCNSNISALLTSMSALLGILLITAAAELVQLLINCLSVTVYHMKVKYIVVAR